MFDIESFSLAKVHTVIKRPSIFYSLDVEEINAVDNAEKFHGKKFKLD